MPVLAATSEYDEVERLFTEQTVEVRGGSGGGPKRVGGYASVFSRPSRPLQGFTEIVTPTFFRASQDNGFAGVCCRFDHDSRALLGTVDAGTLRLSTDSVGLMYEVDIPDTTVGNDLYALVKRSDIRHSSFAFQCPAGGDEWSYDGGSPVRRLLSGVLVDTAPVVLPAYPDSTCAMRSFSRHFGVPIEDVEEYGQRGELRKFFPSHSGARARPSSGKRLTHQQRELELMALKVDPATGRPYGKPPTAKQIELEAMRKKSRHEKILETLAADPFWQQ